MKKSYSILIILASFFLTVPVAQAATLYFSPSSGNFNVGNVFTVNILVDTQNQAVNNAEAVINFPADFLEIISISKSGSNFSLWVEEPTFSNKDGRISFVGGLPTPGFSGPAGKIIGMVFRGKKTGSASLVFSSGAVRANDGLGTNILSDLGAAAFTLSQVPSSAPETTVTPTGLLPTPFIKHYIKDKDGEWAFSRDSEKEWSWLNSGYGKFTWIMPSGVTGVSILLNDRPTSNPGSISDGRFDNKVYENLKDGIYYLHIRYINASGVSPILHYKFGVDTTPPEPFKISLPDGEITANPTPRILFETIDKMSGIDRYEIKIDDNEWVNAAKLKIASYILPKLSPGEHKILVKAYDKAGNYTEEQTKVIISAIASPDIISYPANIISPGETFIISGISAPKATIEIHMNKKGQSPIVFSGQADENGNFEISYNNVIPSGAYEVWAKQILETGSESLQSTSIYIGVNSWFWRAWQWFKNVGGIIVIGLITLAGLAVAGYFFIHRFRMWRIKLRREVHEAENALKKGFKKLRSEIGSAKPAKKILKDLSEIEKTIEKEIKDIEKK